MSKVYDFFATSPKGLELLLADELRELGASHAAEKLAGVHFSGDLAVAYRACLWSRLANSILLRLKTFAAPTPEALYAGIQTIRWDEHIEPTGTLAVHFVSNQSEINHTMFAAQKVKDAIVDQLREQHGERPSVSRDQPDVQIHVYLYRDQATVSIDLSGESLHKRGYRLEGGAAPLKENLAAAILTRAKWPAIAKAGGALIDPMCGSGTLLIEAAMMAFDKAPGLDRHYFGFLKWKKHDAALWATLKAEAMQRYAATQNNVVSIVGYDQSPDAITISFENIARAGFSGKVHVERRMLEDFSVLKKFTTGLLVTNPPYGERLGEVDELGSLYTTLGDKLKQELAGWQAAVFTGNPELGKQMGIRAKKYYALFNGIIPCQLLLFDVSPEKFIDRSVETQNARLIEKAKEELAEEVSPGLLMFINRLRKNNKHYARKAKREGVSEYRIYDVDLPDYAFAIDRVDDTVRVTEYEAPLAIDPQKVLRRRQEVLSVLADVLQLPEKNIFFSIEPRPKFF